LARGLEKREAPTGDRCSKVLCTRETIGAFPKTRIGRKAFHREPRGRHEPK
jgi:hypothetical protein